MIELENYIELESNLCDKLESISTIYSKYYNNGYSFDDFEIDKDLIYITISNDSQGCGYDSTSFKILKKDINEPLSFFDKFFDDEIKKWKKKNDDRIKKEKKDRKIQLEKSDRVQYERLKKKYEE